MQDVDLFVCPLHSRKAPSAVFEHAFVLTLHLTRCSTFRLPLTSALFFPSTRCVCLCVCVYSSPVCVQLGGRNQHRLQFVDKQGTICLGEFHGPSLMLHVSQGSSGVRSNCTEIRRCTLPRFMTD